VANLVRRCASEPSETAGIETVQQAQLARGRLGKRALLTAKSTAAELLQR